METKIKIRKKTIPSVVKRLVWNKYIGEEIGKSKCSCCGLTDITQMSFNCGHIISEYNGGKIEVSNLKPICQNCNSSMGIMNMDEFMKSFKINVKKYDNEYIICECCGRKMKKVCYSSHRRTDKYVLNMKIKGIDASVIKPREKSIKNIGIKKRRFLNKIEEEKMKDICNKKKKLSGKEQIITNNIENMIDKYGFKKYDDILITNFYNYDCLDNLVYLLCNNTEDTKNPETLKRNERNKIIKTIINKLGFSFGENKEVKSDVYDVNVKELFKDDIFKDCEKINKLFGFSKGYKLNNNIRFFNKQLNTMLRDYSLKIKYSQKTIKNKKICSNKLTYIHNLNEIINNLIKINKIHVDIKPFEPEKNIYNGLLVRKLTTEVFE